MPNDANHVMDAGAARVSLAYPFTVFIRCPGTGTAPIPGDICGACGHVVALDGDDLLDPHVQVLRRKRWPNDDAR